ARQPKLGDQAILVGAPGAVDTTLGLWRSSGDGLDAQLRQHPPDLRRRHVCGTQQLLLHTEPVGAWRSEDAVSIAIDGGRNATRGDPLAQQHQVAGGVLLLAEQRRAWLTGGIVDGAQQAPARTVTTKLAVGTAVELQQHAFGRHALATFSVGCWTARVRTAH